MALTSLRSPGGDASALAPARGRGAGLVQGFDGLRAIAALLVIVVHTGFQSGFTFRYPGVGQYFARGEMGVSVFFLISGFLLYRSFVTAAFEGRPGPATGRYLRRRALRIIPLYWVVLGVTYAVGSSPTQGAGGVFGHAFYLQVYTQSWVHHGVSQAWTLCIEVTFYLALPLWAAALRLGHRRASEPPIPRAALRRELAALAVLWAASLLFRWVVVADPTTTSKLGTYWLPAWADHFALGMALAAISAYAARVGALPVALRWMSHRGAALACWVSAGAVYWVASTQIGLSKLPLPTLTVGSDLEGHVLYAAFALLLLMPAVFGPPGRGLVRRLLSSRLLVLIGLISYGIYLWHQLAIYELQKLVSTWRVLASPYPQFAGAVLAAALVLATVTYLVVERPGIALGHRGLLRQRERAALHESSSS